MGTFGIAWIAGFLLGWFVRSIRRKKAQQGFKRWKDFFGEREKKRASRRIPVLQGDRMTISVDPDLSAQERFQILKAWDELYSMSPTREKEMAFHNYGGGEDRECPTRSASSGAGNIG